MLDENTSRIKKVASILRKACPLCGGPAHAEARLPLSASIHPAEIDLDRPALLSSEPGISYLLALVEVIPYKQFKCTQCGHEFKLASQVGKALLVDMVSSMQPVEVVPVTKPASRTKTTRPAKTTTGKVGGTDWEPQSLDPKRRS